MRRYLGLSISCLVCITLVACDQRAPVAADGSWIAFSSENHIFVVPVDGGEPMRLTPGSFDENPTKWPSWSPDGTRLTFLAGWDVFAINSDGSELTNLTDSQEKEEEFAVSRDGATLAIKGIRSLKFIDLGNPANTREIDLTNGSEEYFSWSPDDTKLLFHNKKDGEWQVWTVKVDGSDLRQLTEARHSMRPVWSPDGSRIAFESTRDGSREVYVMNMDGSGETRLTFSDGADISNLQPAWSPDGSKIAYVSDQDGDSELYVMNADGTDPIQLTDNSAWEFLPSWSADGSQIAFVRDELGKPMFFDVWGGDLYVIGADGLGEAQLATDLSSVTLPVWQPTSGVESYHGQWARVER